MTRPLEPEDVTLVTLARAARARVGASAGAAVRDSDGRTYATASVELPTLRLSALRLAVAMAAAAGAAGLEAAATDADGLASSDLDAVRDLGGPGVPVLLLDPGGTVRDRAET